MNTYESIPMKRWNCSVAPEQQLFLLPNSRFKNPAKAQTKPYPSLKPSLLSIIFLEILCDTRSTHPQFPVR